MEEPNDAEYKPSKEEVQEAGAEEKQDFDVEEENVEKLQNDDEADDEAEKEAEASNDLIIQ